MYLHMATLSASGPRRLWPPCMSASQASTLLRCKLLGRKLLPFGENIPCNGHPRTHVYMSFSVDLIWILVFVLVLSTLPNSLGCRAPFRELLRSLE
ncbi:hypothetical protein CC77DRAFT_216710 [Alternaria alternata]|uniref:Uncharacterized protein n=1 Tax=Alternaria alternata TaxID=5599 RepID=A0A177DGB1_ALTAL|nr:hypothetical protein CC77DRAFT_216710 [Alternaria alternata]OAG18220.1 hypothetical protein CC77DRAFT_216710 [Alternaria alternata]